MKSTLKSILFPPALLLIFTALAIWSFRVSRHELEQEQVGDTPIQIPSRVKKTDSGETVITLDENTQRLIGIEIKRLQLVGGEIVFPASAILHQAGQTWVYVQVKPNEFIRREVHLTRTKSPHRLINRDLSAQTPVVSSGAEILLSEEFKSQIQPGGD